MGKHSKKRAGNGRLVSTARRSAVTLAVLGVMGVPVTAWAGTTGSDVTSTPLTQFQSEAVGGSQSQNNQPGSDSQGTTTTKQHNDIVTSGTEDASGDGTSSNNSKLNQSTGDQITTTETSAGKNAVSLSQTQTVALQQGQDQISDAENLIIPGGPLSPVISNEFAGWAIFGHTAFNSQDYGMLNGNFNGAFKYAVRDNLQSHVFMFATNHQMTFHLSAVNPDGSPISNPNGVWLEVRTDGFTGTINSPSGPNPYNAVYLPAGSTGIDFSFTNTSGDVFGNLSLVPMNDDRTVPLTNASSTQNASLQLSQSTKASGTFSTYNGEITEQSALNGQGLIGASGTVQSEEQSTCQNQTITGTTSEGHPTGPMAASVMFGPNGSGTSTVGGQSQHIDASNSQFINTSTGQSLTAQLGQAQDLNGTGSASENQSIIFTALDNMSIYLNQWQQLSATGILQDEGISTAGQDGTSQVNNPGTNPGSQDLNNAKSLAGGTQNGALVVNSGSPTVSYYGGLTPFLLNLFDFAMPGTKDQVSLYYNGKTIGTYSVDPNSNVTVTESQSGTTSNPSAASESGGIQYQVNGQAQTIIVH